MNDSIIKLAKEVPIVDILEKLEIPYKSVGSQIKIQCLWHEEYDPSFVIYDSNWGHCFGCGVNKDSIDIVKELLDLSFVDAVEFINLI